MSEATATDVLMGWTKIQQTQSSLVIDTEDSKSNEMNDSDNNSNKISKTFLRQEKTFHFVLAYLTTIDCVSLLCRLSKWHYNWFQTKLGESLMLSLLQQESGFFFKTAVGINTNIYSKIKLYYGGYGFENHYFGSLFDYWTNQDATTGAFGGFGAINREINLFALRWFINALKKYKNSNNNNNNNNNNNSKSNYDNMTDEKRKTLSKCLSLLAKYMTDNWCFLDAEVVDYVYNGDKYFTFRTDPCSWKYQTEQAYYAKKEETFTRKVKNRQSTDIRSLGESASIVSIPWASSVSSDPYGGGRGPIQTLEVRKWKTKQFQDTSTSEYWSFLKETELLRYGDDLEIVIDLLGRICSVVRAKLEDGFVKVIYTSAQSAIDEIIATSIESICINWYNKDKYKYMPYLAQSVGANDDLIMCIQYYINKQFLWHYLKEDIRNKIFAIKQNQRKNIGNDTSNEDDMKNSKNSQNSQNSRNNKNTKNDKNDKNENNNKNYNNNNNNNNTESDFECEKRLTKIFNSMKNVNFRSIDKAFGNVLNKMGNSRINKQSIREIVYNRFGYFQTIQTQMLGMGWVSAGGGFTSQGSIYFEEVKYYLDKILIGFGDNDNSDNESDNNDNESESNNDSSDSHSDSDECDDNDDNNVNEANVGINNCNKNTNSDSNKNGENNNMNKNNINDDNMMQENNSDKEWENEQQDNDIDIN